jgi:hypothetical protein
LTGRQEIIYTNYWMTFRKREDVGNCKRNCQIAICSELALKEVMVLS